MHKRNSQNGFTLAELLIVVAIIAILVAIAVPVFSAQLEKSREAVDMENARAANSIAMADYLVNHSDVENVYYYFGLDKNDNLQIVLCSEAETGVQHGTQCAIPEHNRYITARDEYNYNYGKSKQCKDSYCIVVAINNGKIINNTFLDALAETS